MGANLSGLCMSCSAIGEPCLLFPSYSQSESQPITETIALWKPLDNSIEELIRGGRIRVESLISISLHVVGVKPCILQRRVKHDTGGLEKCALCKFILVGGDKIKKIHVFGRICQESQRTYTASDMSCRNLQFR